MCELFTVLCGNSKHFLRYTCLWSEAVLVTSLEYCTLRTLKLKMVSAGFPLLPAPLILFGGTCEFVLCDRLRDVTPWDARRKKEKHSIIYGSRKVVGDVLVETEIVMNSESIETDQTRMWPQLWVGKLEVCKMSKSSVTVTVSPSQHGKYCKFPPGRERMKTRQMKKKVDEWVKIVRGQRKRRDLAAGGAWPEQQNGNRVS